MRNRRRLYIVGSILLVAVSVICWWELWKMQTPPTKVVFTSQLAQPIPSASPLPSVFTAHPSTASTPSPQTIDPKAAAIMATWAEQNAQPQNFYGKVIDQSGQSIAGVTAVGTLMQIQGVDVGTKKETYTTTSDGNGLFEFTGLHGWQLGVVVKKEGYEMGRSPGVYRAPNKEDKTNPVERAVFTMWKLKGAEPMVHKKIEAGLSCDGSPMTLDLLTGHRVQSGGDLTLSLIRNPVNIDRSKPFGWSLTLTATEGGLVEIADLYPNEAPAEGCQPTITRNMQAGPPYFTGNKFDQSYYIKSRNGQVYGRMKLHITADYQPPPARLEIEVFANPSGSRNLEYDPSKQASAR